MALKAKLGQQPSVERIRLAAARERLRIVVDVSGIDHGDMGASAVQGNRKGDPVAAGSFEDDQGGLGRNTGGRRACAKSSSGYHGVEVGKKAVELVGKVALRGC